MPGLIRGPARLEQEPGALIGFIDEGLKQPSGRVCVLVGKVVRPAHGGSHNLVVCHQLAKPVVGCNKGGVVAFDRLMPGDIADRAQRGAADLAYPFGQHVRGGKDLLGLLIEQQVIVAKVPSADVPVKILGLQVEREGIGEKRVERRSSLDWAAAHLRSALFA